MRRFAMTISFVLAGVPGYAQISPQALTLAGINDCIKEALDAGSVEDDVIALFFPCSTDNDKPLYNFVGRKVRAEIVQDRNEKFENRLFENNAFYPRVEDPSGKTADDFRCDLILTIGEILSE